MVRQTNRQTDKQTNRHVSTCISIKTLKISSNYPRPRAITCEKCPGSFESNCCNSRYMIYVIVVLFTFQAVTFQCFSVISALVGVALVVTYSFMIFFEELKNRHVEYGNHDAKIAILATILVLGILESSIGCVMIFRLSSPPPQVSRIHDYPFNKNNNNK